MLQYTEMTQEWFEPWLEMALELWPEEKAEELSELLLDQMTSSRHKHIVCLSESGQPIGFANFSIRNDYVEGSETNKVGYVEGIFVKPGHRKRGIGRELLKQGENWAADKGCTEMGSDAYISNIQSRLFHEGSGFTAAGEIVCFIKKI